MLFPELPPQGEPHDADELVIDLLIVGAGFAGLYMLFKARQMGLKARVIEAGGGVGGTWYFNRYPGARVDIQSLEYSYSFSEALQQEWRWSERYAGQPELLRYANHVADRFGLRDGIQLNTELTSAAFDELGYCWRVAALLQGGAVQRLCARFLVMASGPLSSPNWPAFKGLESFKGKVYHTARWPHTSAEKSPETSPETSAETSINNRVDFSGLRVGLVGTGSSAIQLIPILAQEARELTVFQRTAAYCVPARNSPLDDTYQAQVKSSYADFRARNRRMHGGFSANLPPNPVSALAVSPQVREAAFEARWQIGGFALLGAFNDLLLNHESNALVAEFVRQKIRAVVHDPVTAALLCPTQTIGCKRLGVDTGYYETFNRPNVKLVDVSQHAIDEITPDGLTTHGSEYRFDALVLATGFDAITGTHTRLDLRGRGGLTIQEKWRAGPLNYLGLMVAGFPNLFNIAGAGSTSAFTNVIVSIEHHVDWIADCIAYLDANRLTTIEPTQTAEADWIEHVNKAAARTVFLSCNSWYLGANIPGKTRMFMPLAGGFPGYAQRCKQVAQDGYVGFKLA